MEGGLERWTGGERRVARQAFVLVEREREDLLLKKREKASASGGPSG